MMTRAGDFERDSDSGLLLPRRRGVLHARPQFMGGPLFFGGGDPYFSNVSLLLHGNGTNGSTAITDNSKTPKTVTLGGNTAISTSESKFEGASIGFDGTGDYLQAPSQAFGTSDFTLEFFVRFVNFTSAPTLIDNRVVAPTSNLAIYNSGTTVISMYLNGADRAATGALSTATWYHLAVCKASGTTRFFLDGTQQGSNYTDSNNYDHTTLRAGANYLASSSLNGHMDEIRVTLGVARYVANFTAPGAPFSNY